MKMVELTSRMVSRFINTNEIISASGVDILVFRPGEKAEQTTINSNLKAFQDIVDGYIEIYTLKNNAVLVCNEDAKALDLPNNRKVPPFGMIKGTFIICNKDDDGDLVSITPENIRKYSKI